jgi:DNA invertase Pin-like site-specific DNA recombinase
MGSNREKIQPAHLQRWAIIYRRSACQVDAVCWENQRLSLVERAHALGWPEGLITFEQDPGKSTVRVIHRSGYKGVLAQIIAREVGALFVAELTRLTPVSRGVHELAEICAAANTLIITAESVFNTSDPVDRLLFDTPRRRQASGWLLRGISGEE